MKGGGDGNRGEGGAAILRGRWGRGRGGGGTPRVGGTSAGEYLIGLVGAEIRIACYEIRSDI